jgi:hypothetical protein
MVIFDFSVGWRDGKAAGHCCIFQALSAYPGDCLAIVRRQGWHLKGDLIRQSENELPHPPHDPEPGCLDFLDRDQFAMPRRANRSICRLSQSQRAASCSDVAPLRPASDLVMI